MGVARLTTSGREVVCGVAKGRKGCRERRVATTRDGGSRLAFPPTAKREACLGSRVEFDLRFRVWQGSAHATRARRDVARYRSVPARR